MLACRGIVVSYKSIRQWCLKFTPTFAKSLRKKQGALGDEWYLDKFFIKINGKRHLLKAKHYREIMGHAFEQWPQITCAQNLEKSTKKSVPCIFSLELS